VSTVSVRYIVDDVDRAVAFYGDHLGFEVVMHPAPGFAMLQRGDLRLLLNAPGAGGAGRAGDDATPEPGGWNRFQLTETDLDATVERLRDAGAQFRSGIVAGSGGRQALVADPAGNVVELFEPAER
jgi:catechol 2,3-dioxygenase-like lactoylglutathione lyase family enzyme